jgi:hypothetical protein
VLPWWRVNAVESRITMETGYTSFGGAGGQKIKQGFEVLAGAESGAGAKKSKVLLRVNWNGCGVRYIEADRKNSTQ